MTLRHIDCSIWRMDRVVFRRKERALIVALTCHLVPRMVWLAMNDVQARAQYIVSEWSYVWVGRNDLSPERRRKHTLPHLSPSTRISLLARKTTVLCSSLAIALSLSYLPTNPPNYNNKCSKPIFISGSISCHRIDTHPSVSGFGGMVVEVKYAAPNCTIAEWNRVEYQDPFSRSSVVRRRTSTI